MKKNAETDVERSRVRKPQKMLEYILLKNNQESLVLLDKLYPILEWGIPDPDEREAKENLAQYLVDNDLDFPELARKKLYYGRRCKQLDGTFKTNVVLPIQRQRYNLLVGIDKSGKIRSVALFNFIASEESGNSIGWADYLVVDKNYWDKNLGTDIYSEAIKIMHCLADGRGFWENPKKTRLLAVVQEVEEEHPDEDDLNKRQYFAKKQGFKVVDSNSFDYVQPALTPNQEPVENLELYILPQIADPKFFSNVGISRKCLAEILTMETCSLGENKYRTGFLRKKGYPEMMAQLGVEYDFKGGYVYTSRAIPENEFMALERINAQKPVR